MCSEKHYFLNIAMSINTLNVYDSKSFSCIETYLGNPNLYSPLVHPVFYNRMQIILITPVFLSCHLMQMLTNNKYIITLDGAKIEVVSSYKYLRIWLDSSLTFTKHITNLQKKVKSRLSFLFQNRSVFTTSANKYLVETTVLPRV